VTAGISDQSHPGNGSRGWPSRHGRRPCYLLPLRWGHGRHDPGELARYLRQVAQWCDVLVVDGSPEPVFRAHQRAWSPVARHIRPDPALGGRNGKVGGVITGMRAATSEYVIIADDDVRYDGAALSRVVARLDDADLVVPQNYFRPLPWHAVWDSARSLLNRALATDYPGTLAVRRPAFLAAGGYDGDVLFENLELMRTMRAAGARVTVAPDVFVRRIPPDTRQFLGQRVRQAYDSLAQPPRLAAELALLPAALLAGVRRPAVLGGACAVAVAVAEAGRRRHGGTAVFPWPTALLAPAWLAERSVCSWLAVLCRLRGGVRYGGQRIGRAANSATALRATHAARARAARGYPPAGSNDPKLVAWPGTSTSIRPIRSGG
jgi:Glycosyl transferase family 2